MPDTKRRFILTNLVSLAIGFLLLAIIVAASFALVTHQQNAQRAVVEATGTMSGIHRVFSAVLDAESGQRGYLIVGHEDYLAPYRAAVAVLDRELEALAARLDRGGQREEALAALRRAVREKLDELAATIERRRAGDVDGALAIVRTDAGQRLMDEIREATAQLLARQAAVIDARQHEVDAARWRLRLVIVVASILVLAVAALTFWTSWQQTSAVLRSRDELTAVNARLVEEAAQRGELEAKLRQSQKMEAIGQLTGGLAHDFNNMLAIIVGSLGMAMRRLKRGDRDVEKFLGNAMEGAERATTLTHRLLAFARQQPLSPQPIDVNKFVAGLADLLRRTLGEHIQLETVLAGGLWRTHADPSQLENAILNLAVNARDAMPDGGKLTIETQNAALDDDYAIQHAEVPAGQYVLIAVTDTGTGMAPDVMAKAFDPFFTTKGPGRGTGLGLSQVYGFVKQSAGHIKIYSEIGQGTTMKIYLPRFFGTGGAAEAAQPKAVPQGHVGQVVLVVEDEDRVRQLSVESLKELGYTVVEASGAATALRLLDERPDVALLFTDIVMPDVNGRKLADEAVLRKPGLRVLFTTGYTRNAIVHNGVLDPGTHLITKPFTLDQLARKVSEVLNGP